MVRKKRLWHPGDFYHIYNRGNRLMPVFDTTMDRMVYLRFLEKARRRFPFKLHAYALMPNHIHLLIETVNDPPQQFMHHVHSLYAQYFNKKNDLVGHLFQGRYQALPIDNPEYFHQTGTYIHRNPFKANLKKEATNPYWSSYPFFIYPEKHIHHSFIIPIERKLLLEYFPNNPSLEYRRFIEKILDQGATSETGLAAEPSSVND